MTDVLPTTPAHLLADRREPGRWLVEALWSDPAVGIIGGEPKCGKTFLALDLAVAIASGRPCLGRFPVHRTGPVLLYAAEDDPGSVRRRLEGLAARARVDLAQIDIHVITVPSLRIDLAPDQQRLAATVAHIRPILLVLDPFVRLHRVDENASGDVAAILDHLRVLQRQHGTGVVLVHHAKKNGHHLRAGQALRGSSELHAWGDCNLFLRRTKDRILLSAEHRQAPGLDQIPLRLDDSDGALALRVDDHADRQTPDDPPGPTPRHAVEQVLRQADRPLTLRQVRKLCRLRTERVQNALHELQQAGLVARDPAGYQILDRLVEDRFPFPAP